jgi:hypothetical protein
MTLALTNGNIPAIVLTLICLQTMKFFQRTGFGFGESRTFFGGAGIRLYMMGLGQGNRAAPPSLIQLSAVLVYVFKQLELGALAVDPNTQELIHYMGTLFVDDTDLDTWKDGLLNTEELWLQTQLDLRYLQLQLGTPHNPITLEYNKWGYLTPLSWVKMLWRLLHHFNIHLRMECAQILSPRERDQFVMRTDT